MVEQVKSLPLNQGGKRLQFLDVAKGILIILVVLGHTHLPFSIYIYWFHLPAFFIISGLLHKQPDKTKFKDFVWKKTLGLMRPYFAFGISVIFIMAVYAGLTHTGNPIKIFATLLGRLAFGGRALFWTLGPFWFIPCLCLTIISFTAILHFITNKKVAMAAVFLSFVIGMLTLMLNRWFIPFNANVVPVAVFYYGVGYYAKNIVNQVYQMETKKWLIVLPVISFCILLIYIAIKGYFFFDLDMKISKYSNYVLAVFIPLLFTAGVLLLSMVLKFRFLSSSLSYIGLNSLIIMYLHYPVNNAIMTLTGYQYESNYVLFVVLGVSIPLIIGLLLNTNQFTRKIFLISNKKASPAVPGNQVLQAEKT
ncbi:acyltransferase family protein [soil metagenome]